MNNIKNNICDFYDSFTNTMVNDRLSVNGNTRIEKIKDTLTKFVREADVVFEIGCGIGILTEYLIKKCGAKKVIAVDISGNNISYAKETVKCENIEWIRSDVLEKGLLEKIIGDHSSINCVLMADVIEHIPIDEHKAFFKALNPFLAIEARLILTYPSPFYTKYLIDNKPELLQPVDQIILPKELDLISDYTEAIIIYYELKDAWKEREYTHVVLEHKPRLLGDVIVKAGKSWINDLMHPFIKYYLRRKYYRKILKYISAKPK